MDRHLRSCPAYGNYQPPYEACDCGYESQRTKPLTQADIREAHGKKCDCCACDNDGYWQSVHRGSQ
jgi:hypothetical protein